MLYGVKIAVSKEEVRECGEALWKIVESYDSLLRRYKINMITWNIIDLGKNFIITAMIPGDYKPELTIAKMALEDGVEKIASGNLSLESVRPEDFL